MSDLETLLAERIAAGALKIAEQLTAVRLKESERDWRKLGAVSIEETRQILGGLSRSTIVRMLDAGELTELTTRDGGRRMVTVHSIRRQLREL